MKHKDDRAEKALEEAYEEIKKLKEFQLGVSIILGTTRKPMLEEIRELKHRADVAAEALRLAIKRADISYFKCNYTKLCNFRTYECGSEECINIIMEAYKQETEARLKELEAENDRD